MHSSAVEQLERHISEAEFSRQAASWITLGALSCFERNSEKRYDAVFLSLQMNTPRSLPFETQTQSCSTSNTVPPHAQSLPVCHFWEWTMIQTPSAPPILQLSRDVLILRRQEVDAVCRQEVMASGSDSDSFLAECELDDHTNVDSTVSKFEASSRESPATPRTPNDGIPALRVRFQIIYDRVYGVPALCFEAWDERGVSVSHSELALYINMISDQNADSRTDADVMVTQIEHTYTERPVFQIHPCRTASMMGTILAHSTLPIECYLLQWFNVYGRQCGLVMEPGNFARAVAHLSTA